MSNIITEFPDITVVVNTGDTYGVVVNTGDTYGVIVNAGDTYSVNVTNPQVVVDNENNYYSVADYALMAATASYVSGVVATWNGVANKPDGLVSSSQQVVQNISGSQIQPLLIQVPQIRISSETSYVYMSASVVTGVYNETRIINPSIFIDQFSGAAVEYVAQNLQSVRTGIVMGSWSGSVVTYTDISNTDVGNTSNLSFNFAKVNNEVRLRAVSSGSESSPWTIQCLFKLFPNLL
jgi:hypothetical protein